MSGDSLPSHTLPAWLIDELEREERERREREDALTRWPELPKTDVK